MKNKNIFKGSLYGIIYEIIVIILAFSLRTVLVNSLGNDYVSLITIYTSIFGLLLSLDGGMASAIFIKIHTPIAKGDEQETARVYNTIKIVYIFRALMVSIVGIIIMFFLPTIIESNLPMDMIYLSYIVYMFIFCFNNALAYKMFLVETLQLRYKVLQNQIIFTSLCYVLNIVLLIVFKNFIIYVILSLLFQTIINYRMNNIIKQHLPCVVNKKITKEGVDSKEVIDYTKMALHTLSDIFIKNTDNLLVNSIISFSTVGLLSNYRMIIINIQNCCMQVLLAVKDPMRNRMAINDEASVKQLHSQITFVSYLLATFVSVCLLVLLNPFISLWLGAEHLLEFWPIYFLVSGTFIFLVTFPIIDAYYFNNCYKKDYWTPVLEIVINLIFSIVLGLWIGLLGIFIGTFIYYIYRLVKRSKVYYNRVYKESNKAYVLTVVKYFAIFNIFLFITYYTVSLISFNNVFLEFSLQMITCVFIISLLLIICYFNKVKAIYKQMRG